MIPRAWVKPALVGSVPVVRKRPNNINDTWTFLTLIEKSEGSLSLWPLVYTVCLFCGWRLHCWASLASVCPHRLGSCQPSLSTWSLPSIIIHVQVSCRKSDKVGMRKRGREVGRETKKSAEGKKKYSTDTDIKTVPEPCLCHSKNRRDCTWSTRSECCEISSQWVECLQHQFQNSG